MNLEDRKKRLIFRSEHRGTKEMDLLLGSFARKYVPGFDEAQVGEYEDLLINNDPDLYNWITGKEDAPDEVKAMAVFSLIDGHQYKS